MTCALQPVAVHQKYSSLKSPLLGYYLYLNVVRCVSNTICICSNMDYAVHGWELHRSNESDGIIIVAFVSCFHFTFRYFLHIIYLLFIFIFITLKYWLQKLNNSIFLFHLHLHHHGGLATLYHSCKHSHPLKHSFVLP